MRRMFRRHIRMTIAQEVPPILQEANFALDQGEFGRAGELFKRLAETTSARGGPRPPLFHLKAGDPDPCDELEWLDEVTAKCAYCGSPIRS